MNSSSELNASSEWFVETVESMNWIRVSFYNSLDKNRDLDDGTVGEKLMRNFDLYAKILVTVKSVRINTLSTPQSLSLVINHLTTLPCSCSPNIRFEFQLYRHLNMSLCVADVFPLFQFEYEFSELYELPSVHFDDLYSYELRFGTYGTIGSLNFVCHTRKKLPEGVFALFSHCERIASQEEDPFFTDMFWHPSSRGQTIMDLMNSSSVSSRDVLLWMYNNPHMLSHLSWLVEMFADMYRRGEFNPNRK